ncbi:hypothetical protein ACFFKU_00935 [Kineococcus gynurae]|uniref:Sugar lactone lactonase YvrE n=2 Tax=Kineococcus gynurae TaxID=452979 RepID=A0ABV5LPU2_9ACTN
MRRRASRRAVLAAGILGTALTVGVGQPAVAAAGSPLTRVGTQSFYDAPDLSYAYGRLYVAEPRANRVSSLDLRGRARVEVTEVPSVQAADRSFGRILSVTGARGYVPDLDLDASVPQPPDGWRASMLFVNPLGQKAKPVTTFRTGGGRGNPVDVLGPTFAGGPVLVVDRAAGVVRLVEQQTGRSLVLFRPPTGVPVSVARGPRGLYVAVSAGTLSDAGAVYVLNPVDGRVRSVVKGFFDPSQLTVAPDGTIFLTQEWYPWGGRIDDPAYGDPPCACGQIVRIAGDGSRSYLTMAQPSGIAWGDGRLFATQNSTSPWYFRPSPWSQVVQVDLAGFGPGSSVQTGPPLSES